MHFRSFERDLDVFGHRRRIVQRSVARRDRSLLTTPELFKSLDDLVGLEVGVAHAEVDAKAGDADLHLHVEAARPEPRSDLVDHEQVERQRAGLDEPGQGERRHHETRLKGLHALAGTCQDLTHRR